MSDRSAEAPPRRWWSYRLPWAALALGLLVTVLARAAISAKTSEIAADRFARLTEQVAAQLDARIAAYLQVLRGAQGLWHSGVPVTRAAWRQYVETLALEQGYRGVLGVGYVEMASAAQRAALEQRIRREAAAQPEAVRGLFEGFAIHPPGPRPVYSAVIYLEPFRDRNLRAFGYDMYADTIRREAMDRARDTGEPAISGRVRLVQETDVDVQPGFLVYLPVYSGTPRTLEERRAQLRGFVYSPFRAHDLMRNVLPTAGLYLQYALYDGPKTTDDHLLFRSDAPGDEPPRATLQSTGLLQVGGRTWTIDYRPGPLLAFADRNALRLTALSGVLISLLLFALTLAISTTRQRADQLAHRMTANLREREQEVERMAGQLRQSNEDLQQFAYAASHDLKEPLRSIAGSLGLLARRFKPGLDESARELLGYANDGAQRLSGLIDNLLDYSRVQSPAGPAQPVDLEEAVDTALRDLGSLIADSGARITREPLPHVLGDRAQLIRVMQNLLDNAIKYSRQHAPVPEVRITAQRDGGQWVIGIADNGIGIAPEHHDKVFVMFKRLHTRQEYEGNGMGLALCKRIVQRLGGRIWLESRAGAGATFYVSLAAADVVAAPPGAPAETSTQA
jgi:signal transduction histidine kinase